MRLLSPYKSLLTLAASALLIFTLIGTFQDMSEREASKGDQNGELKVIRRVGEDLRHTLASRQQAVAELDAWMAHTLIEQKEDVSQPELYDLLYAQFSSTLEQTDTHGLIYFGNDDGGILVAGRVPPGSNSSQWQHFCDLAYNSQGKIARGNYAEFFVPPKLRNQAVSSFLSKRTEPIKLTNEEESLRIHFLVDHKGPHLGETSPRPDLQQGLLNRLKERFNAQARELGIAYDAKLRPWFQQAPTSPEPTRSYGLFGYYNGLSSGVSALRRVTFRVGRQTLSGVLAVDCSSTQLEHSMVTSLESMENTEAQPLAAFVIAPPNIERDRSTMPRVVSISRVGHRLLMDPSAISETLGTLLKETAAYEWERLELPNLSITSAIGEVSARVRLMDLPSLTRENEPYHLPWKVGIIYADDPQVIVPFMRSPFAWLSGKIGVPLLILPVLAIVIAVILCLKVLEFMAKNEMMRLRFDAVTADMEMKHHKALQKANSRTATLTHKLRMQRIELMGKCFHWLHQAFVFFHHEIKSKLHDPAVAKQFVEGELLLATALYSRNPKELEKTITSTADLVSGLKDLDVSPLLTVKTYRHIGWRITAELVANAYRHGEPGIPPKCRLARVTVHRTDSFDSSPSDAETKQSTETRQGWFAWIARLWRRSPAPVPMPTVPAESEGNTAQTHSPWKPSVGKYLTIRVMNQSRRVRQMPLKKREQLFAAMNTPPSANSSGTGLGLYSSRHLAETVGGGLTLTDGELEDEILFTLWLPMEETNETIMAANDYDIVVLDDDASTLAHVKRELSPLANVKLFALQSEAEAAAGSPNTGLVLLDQNLDSPAVQGTDVAQRLRRAGYQGMIILHSSDVRLRDWPLLKELKAYFILKSDQVALATNVQDCINDWEKDYTYAAHTSDMQTLLDAAEAEQALNPLNLVRIGELAATKIQDPVLRHTLAHLAHRRAGRALRELIQHYQNSNTSSDAQ